MLFQEAAIDVPVVLVGNKTDQWGDRMVTLEEGQRRSKEIGCVCFHEISVRESIEQVETTSKTVLITELSVTKAVVLQSQCSMLVLKQSLDPNQLVHFPFSDPHPTQLAALNTKSASVPTVQAAIPGTSGQKGRWIS